MRRVLLLMIVAACGKPEPTPQPTPVAAPTTAKPDASVEDRACLLEIVLDDAATTIATSAGACRGEGMAWVEEQLKRLKEAMADCGSAVIVAERGPYQATIDVMDVAVKVGFRDTGLGRKSDVELSTEGAGAQCALPSPPPPPPRVATAGPPPRVIPGPDGTIHGIDLTGELTAQKPLPPARRTDSLAKAPVIVVTKTEVLLQSSYIAGVDDVIKDANALGSLASSLRVQAQATQVELVILQADAGTDMRVINAVIETTKKAGFDNVLFAVKNR